MTYLNTYDPNISTIKIDGTLNLRDLGGMSMGDGRPFPYKVFVRSGTLSDSTPEAFQELIEYGITAVIDLRSVAEVIKYGNPAKDCPAMEFYNIPLFIGDPDAKEDPTMIFLKTHYLGDFYVMVLEELGSEIVRILNILGNAKGCALFHCAHGKDRTGIIAAILYLIAGAKREDIIRNYEFSYEYIKWFLDPLIELKADDSKHTLRSDRINMEIMLDHLDNNYGGDIHRYLTSKGMTEEEFCRLKRKIVSS